MKSKVIRMSRAESAERMKPFMRMKPWKEGWWDKG